MPRSYKSGADGVVSSAGLRRRAELTTPSATNRNGSIVFDVADTPPLRGGECAPKTLSKKLKVAALLHKGFVPFVYFPLLLVHRRVMFTFSPGAQFLNS